MRRPLSDGIYVDGDQNIYGAGERGRRTSPISAASVRCAAATMRRTRPVRPSPLLGARASAEQIQRGAALVSRPRAPDGADRPKKGAVLFVNDSEGAPMRTPRRRRWPRSTDIYWIAGGKPKAGGIDQR